MSRTSILFILLVNVLSSCVSLNDDALPTSKTVSVNTQILTSSVSPLAPTQFITPEGSMLTNGSGGEVLPISPTTETPDPDLTLTTAPLSLLSSHLIEKSTIGRLEEIRSIKLDGSGVQSLSFSNDGTLLGAATYDGTIYVWDTSSMQETYKSEISGLKNAKIFSQSSDDILLAQDTTEGIRVSDLFTGELRFELGGSLFLGEIAISKSGKLIASRTWDNKNIILWDRITQKQTHYLVGDWISEDDVPYNSPFTVLISPDDSILVAVFSEKSIIWDLATGERTKELYNASAFSFSSDGDLLVASINRAEIAVFNTSTWERIQLIKDNNIRIGQAVFSNNDELLVSFTDDGSITIWEWESGTKLSTLTAYRDDNLALRADDVLYGVGGQFLAFSPDGTLLVTYHSYRGNSQTGRRLIFWRIGE